MSEPEKKDPEKKPEATDGRLIRGVNLWVLLLLMAVVLFSLSMWASSGRSSITYAYLK